MKRKLVLKAIFASILVSSVAVAGIRLNGMSMQGPTGADKKCNDMGYRAGDLHTACIRAVTADFCGDGTSHTVDGIAVDFYDPRGIQKPTLPLLPVEAEWGINGATCVSEAIAELGYRAGSSVASCVKALPRCDQAGRPRALIVTAR